MKIYLGADHNGFEYKIQIAQYLKKLGHEVIDDGDNELNPDDDFPQFASKVVSNVLVNSGNNSDEVRGILICGSGQGMCMAANRYKGIRASMVSSPAEAQSARNDDDSNVLCLAARFTDLKQAELIINVWLLTPFSGAPRFIRRLKQLDQLG